MKEQSSISGKSKSDTRSISLRKVALADLVEVAKAADKGLKAVNWYRKAAEQGGPEAQLILGVMYEQGRGVTKNEKEAVKWYGLADDQGHVNAQLNLGILLQEGPWLDKDYPKN